MGKLDKKTFVVGVATVVLAVILTPPLGPVNIVFKKVHDFPN